MAALRQSRKERDNLSRVRESYDRPAQENMDAIQAVIDSEQAVLRYVGAQDHSERTISREEKSRLETVLAAYKGLTP